MTAGDTPQERGLSASNQREADGGMALRVTAATPSELPV